MPVAVLEVAADPREAIPTPHSAVIWFSEAITAAGSFEMFSDAFRRLMRFTYNSNHFAPGQNSTVFTTNFWSPQSSIRSLTLAIWLSTIASCSRTDVLQRSTALGLSSRGPESSCTPISGAIIGRRMATSRSRSTLRKPKPRGWDLLRAEMQPHSRRTIPPMRALRICESLGNQMADSSAVGAQHAAPYEGRRRGFLIAAGPRQCVDERAGTRRVVPPLK